MGGLPIAFGGSLHDAIDKWRDEQLRLAIGERIDRSNTFFSKALYSQRAIIRATWEGRLRKGADASQAPAHRKHLRRARRPRKRQQSGGRQGLRDFQGHLTDAQGQFAESPTAFPHSSYGAKLAL